MDIELDNKIFQRNLTKMLKNEKKCMNFSSENVKQENMKNDFIDLIHKFSENFNKAETIDLIEDNSKSNELIKTITLINLNLNFQEDLFKLIEKENSILEEDKMSSNYDQDNKKAQENNQLFRGKTRNFNKLSLNIIGLSTLNINNFF